MKIQLIALVGLVAASTVAFAGNNAAPLGFELGTTTRSAVQTNLQGKVVVVEGGANRYSDGVMLEAAGGNFGIEDLQLATFVFDGQEQLVAVELQFQKGSGNQNVAKIADVLRANYHQVQRSIPLVGNASARYTHGASVIVLDAPHLDFQFTVDYMTTKFERVFLATRAKEKSDTERATRSKL